MNTPPEGTEDGTYHWFHAERSSYPAISQWFNDQGWYCINEVGPVSPEELRRRGWEYLGPCENRPHSVFLDF